MIQRLSSLKPYLFKAYYDWLLKNDITPHLWVDATVPKVQVPSEYVKDGSIILSLLPTAISEFICMPRGISFKARFKGVSEDIFIPYIAMEQLIALETGSALPIGKMLEQLDLSPEPEDDDIYPDEGVESDGPDFEVEECDGTQNPAGEESLEDSQSVDENNPSDQKNSDSVTSDKETKTEPGFSFVDE